MTKVAIGIVALFGFILSALFFFYAVFYAVAHTELSIRQHSFARGFILPAISAFVLGLLCVWTSIGLTRGNPWAWWVALFGAVAIFVSGAALVYLAFYSTDAYIRSESGFGLIIGVTLAVPASVSMAFLLLHGVRQRFFPHNVSLT
jgi:hypothetical protein